MGTSFSRIGAAIGTWLVPMSLDTIGIGNTMFAAAGVTISWSDYLDCTCTETRAMSLEEATSLNH